MSKKNLPPLQVGIAYHAADFEYFEYSSGWPHDKEPILRLHLSNKTTIDLHTTHEELIRLKNVLSQAYPINSGHS